MKNRHEMMLRPAANGGWTIEVGVGSMIRGGLFAYTSTADMLEGLTQMIAADLQPADPPQADDAGGFTVAAYQPDGSVKVTRSTKPEWKGVPIG